MNTTIKFIYKLTNDDELRKRIPLKYWDRVVKFGNLNNEAIIIQRFLKGWLERRTGVKAEAYRKLQLFFRGAIRNMLIESMIESNYQYAEPLRRSLKQSKKLDKRYTTNCKT